MQSTELIARARELADTLTEAEFPEHMVPKIAYLNLMSVLETLTGCSPATHAGGSHAEH